VQGQLARTAGTVEFSRVRANECPYADKHGMSLASGGTRERVTEATFMHELNLPVDPSAKLGNWGLVDVEKICNEAKLLNPICGPTSAEFALSDLMLPGDAPHDVGQNPRVGSSIGATQHTQIWSASLASYSVFQQRSARGLRQEAALGGGSYDVVRVGLESADALFVIVAGADVTSSPVLDFLTALRLQILSHYGGEGAVDFLVKAMGDGEGGVVAVLVPVAQLEKRPKDDERGYRNPLTGDDQSKYRILAPCIDTGKGCGVWMLDDAAARSSAAEEGEAALRRLYDFTRCPGCAAVVADFVAGWMRTP